MDLGRNRFHIIGCGMEFDLQRYLKIGRSPKPRLVLICEEGDQTDEKQCKICSALRFDRK